MNADAPYARMSTEELGKTLGAKLKKDQRAELKKRSAEGDTRAEELLIDARERENDVKRRRKAQKKRQEEEDYQADSVEEEQQVVDEASDDSDIPLIRRASNRSMAPYAPYAKVSTEDLGKMLGKKLKPKQREELKKRAEEGDMRAEELLKGARAKEKEDTQRRRAEKKQRDEEDAYEDEEEGGPTQQTGQDDDENSDTPIAQVKRKKGVARPVKRTERRDRPTSRASRTSMQEAIVYSTDEDAIIDHSTPRASRRRRRMLLSDDEDAQIVARSVQAVEDLNRDDDQQAVVEDRPSLEQENLPTTAKATSDIDQRGPPVLQTRSSVEDRSRDVVPAPITSGDRAARAANMKADKEEGDRLMERLERLQRERRERDQQRK